MFDWLITAIQAAAVFGILICFAVVVIGMIQRGETTIWITCLVTMFCLIGFLIAYVYGLVKMKTLGLHATMAVWTTCLLAHLLGYLLLMPGAGVR